MPRCIMRCICQYICQCTRRCIRHCTCKLQEQERRHNPHALLPALPLIAPSDQLHNSSAARFPSGQPFLTYTLISSASASDKGNSQVGPNANEHRAPYSSFFKCSQNVMNFRSLIFRFPGQHQLKIRSFRSITSVWFVKVVAHTKKGLGPPSGSPILLSILSLVHVNVLTRIKGTAQVISQT